MNIDFFAPMTPPRSLSPSPRDEPPKYRNKRASSPTSKKTRSRSRSRSRSQSQASRGSRGSRNGRNLDYQSQPPLYENMSSQPQFQPQPYCPVPQTVNYSKEYSPGDMNNYSQQNQPTSSPLSYSLPQQFGYTSGPTHTYYRPHQQMYRQQTTSLLPPHVKSQQQRGRSPYPQKQQSQQQQREYRRRGSCSSCSSLDSYDEKHRSRSRHGSHRERKRADSRLSYEAEESPSERRHSRKTIAGIVGGLLASFALCSCGVI